MEEYERATTDWYPRNEGDYDRLKGKTVYSSDGQPIGQIAAVFHPRDEHPAIPEGSPGHYFLLTDSRLTGPVGAEELYMPDTAISGVSGDRVTVAWTRDELENEGWTNRPKMVEQARRT
jgi:hypothetical protein